MLSRLRAFWYWVMTTGRGEKPRRCRWCTAVIDSAAAVQRLGQVERPHCDSPTCDWGRLCWQVCLSRFKSEQPGEVTQEMPAVSDDPPEEASTG